MRRIGSEHGLKIKGRRRTDVAAQFRAFLTEDL